MIEYHIEYLHIFRKRHKLHPGDRLRDMALRFRDHEKVILGNTGHKTGKSVGDVLHGAGGQGGQEPGAPEDCLLLRLLFDLAVLPIHTLHRPVKRLDQVFIFHGLHQKIKGRQANGSGRVLDFVVSGNENDSGIGQFILHLFQHGQAVHLRHLDIADEDVRMEGADHLAALNAIGRAPHKLQIMLRPGDGLFHRFQRQLIVVDQQNTIAHYLIFLIRWIFLKEPLIKSARTGSERFFSRRRVQKWRNTVCISHF